MPNPKEKVKNLKLIQSSTNPFAEKPKRYSLYGTYFELKQTYKLYLSRTYCHTTGTRPPSCTTPREITMYRHTNKLARLHKNSHHYALFIWTGYFHPN